MVSHFHATLIENFMFLFLQRRIRDLDYHEKTHEREFIPNDYLSMLYLHQGFIEKKAEEGKPDTAILTKPTEPYVPGKKLYVNPTKRSLLTKRQQSQCLAALKRLRSGKDSDKYTKFEQINIDVYKVEMPNCLGRLVSIFLLIEIAREDSGGKCKIFSGSQECVVEKT